MTIKKYFFLPVIYMLIIMGCSASAEQFVEGKNYKRLENPKIETGDTVSVIEFFNYACPHCYHLEDTLTAWKKKKPDYVKFESVPAFWNPYFENMAKAFYTAELLGKKDELHQPIFDAIHVKRRALKDSASIADLFAEHGVESASFKKTFNSFAVEQKITLAASQFRDFQLRSVPSFVVGGIYSVDVTSAGGPDKLIMALDFLADKVKKSRMTQ